MLDQQGIEAALNGLPLGGLRIFQTIGSTNDEALAWARGGAPDLAFVVADEQTSGRGRSGRTWLTPRGTALAMSLVLRRPAPAAPGRFAGLGSLAVAEACEALGMAAEIKWPNDVLVRGRKVAGVLAEAIWNGDRMDGAVLGIGVNVLRGSTPPPDELIYPAISIEEAIEKFTDRLEVLRLVLTAALNWLPRLNSEDFRLAWQERLAFRGRQVTISGGAQPAVAGILSGLEDDGSLRLLADGRQVLVSIGETHLHAADDRMP